MKRMLACLMILMIALSFSSCGQNDGENDSVHEHAEEKGLNLRIGLAAEEGAPHYVAAEQFAKEIEAKSDGVIKATVYGFNKLGSEEELIASIVKDEDKVDIVISDVLNFTKYDAKVDISKMPYAFADYEEARQFMDGEIQAEAASGLEEQNMQVLAYYTNGFHYMTLRDRWTNNVKDLQGLTIATSQESEGVVAMKTMGSMTRACEMSELQQALAQGQCAGYEGSLETIYNNRIYQMQKSLLVTNHSYSAVCFVMADSVWSKLGQEYQEMLKEAAVSSSYTDYELVRQQDREMLAKIESAGVQVHYPNLKEFWEKAEPVVQSYSSTYGNLTNKLIMWKNSR